MCSLSCVEAPGLKGLWGRAEAWHYVAGSDSPSEPGIGYQGRCSSASLQTRAFGRYHGTVTKDSGSCVVVRLAWACGSLWHAPWSLGSLDPELHSVT